MKPTKSMNDCLNTIGYIPYFNSWTMGEWGRVRVKRPTEKPKVKCGLSGCNNMSVKDYCCAEHCKEDRKK